MKLVKVGDAEKQKPNIWKGGGALGGPGRARAVVCGSEGGQHARGAYVTAVSLRRGP